MRSVFGKAENLQYHPLWGHPISSPLGSPRCHSLPVPCSLVTARCSRPLLPILCFQPPSSVSRPPSSSPPSPVPRPPSSVIGLFNFVVRKIGLNGNIGMENLLQRITFDPRVLNGKPLIRGLRISVEMILELLAKGANKQEILEDYPELEPADIQAALSCS